MARRDLLSHTVWLRSIEGEPADGREAPSTALLKDRDEDLLRFINRKGYLVEFWVDGDALRCRFYPLRDRMALRQPPVALSYSASGIRQALIAAMLDIAALGSGERRYHVSTREHVRWAR